MLPRPLDWSLMVPARPPTRCKSTKSRLPDAEITKERRSLHLDIRLIDAKHADAWKQLSLYDNPGHNRGSHPRGRDELPWATVLLTLSARNVFRYVYLYACHVYKRELWKKVNQLTNRLGSLGVRILWGCAYKITLCSSYVGVISDICKPRIQKMLVIFIEV